MQEALLAISHLRQQQNMLCPINKLPPELLSRIFQEVSSDEISSLHRQSLSLSWLAVTYVCRIWIITAVDCPLLWTDIPIDLGRPWSQAFCTRSKAAPLSLTKLHPPYDIMDPKFSWLLELVTEHFQRFSILDIGGYFNVKAIRLLLVTTIPHRLFRLSLKAIDNFGLPCNNLIGLIDARQLQDVCMSRMSLAWDALPWTTLRRVSVYHPPSDSATSSFASLLASLQAATVLEALNLGIQSCPFDASTITMSSVVQLPRLRVLRITAHAADCGAFLKAVQIPQTASINVYVSDDSRGVADFALVGDLLQTHTGRGVSNPHVRLKTLAINMDSDESCVRLRLGPSCDHALDSVPTSRPLVDVTLCSPTSFRANATNILQYVNVSSVRTVHFHGNGLCHGSDDPPWKKRDWYKFSNRAKRVERLQFTGNCARQFLEALSTTRIPSTVDPALPGDADTNNDAKKSTDQARKIMTFSGLRQVHFSDCICSASVLHDFDSDLSAFIRRRSRSSVPLKSISFTSCAIDADTVLELKEIEGLEVDWDGVDIRDEENTEDSENSDGDEESWDSDDQ